MTKIREVRVVDYDPTWPNRFAIEAQHLQQVFTAEQISIEHIGSTAVPDLKAKPIIDILIGAGCLTTLEQHIHDLEALGYEYLPMLESIFPERRFFKKHDANYAGFHLHAVVKESDFWCKHLRFRDILREHPALAEQYALLKTKLAAQYRYDIESYVQGKTELVTKILADYP